VKAARDFWASDKAFLLFCGATGEGKTIAAVSLMAECRFPFHHPDFGATWCWPTTLSHRPRYELAGTLAQASHYGEAADDGRRRAITCKLLVIDELGAEVMTEPWLSRLEHIIDQRYRAKRRTVLVSNLNKKGFKDRYGARIARRIRDDGKVWPAGPDLRAVTP
jgi:DNA replication protein DnaC